MDDEAAEFLTSLEKEKRLGRKFSEGAAGVPPADVFGEPVTFGSYTILPATEFFSGRRKTYRRPVAAVVVGPEGVQVRTMENRVLLNFARAAVAFWIVWGVVFTLHPAWRGNVGLISEIEQVIRALRARQKE